MARDFCKHVPIYAHVNIGTYINLHTHIIIIIIIIIIIFINCNWVITRWQWLIYMYTNIEKKVSRKFKSEGYMTGM
jgi:hypothetical protein